METAFGWLGKLFEFLGSLLPRLLIVDYTQIGVAFKRGKHVCVLRPGLHVYWPFWTTVEVRPAVTQTERLPTQALQTKDLKRIVAGGMVRYRVTDAHQALAETYDLDDAIVDEALAVICQYITSQTFVELQQDRQKINTAITYKIRAVLAKYGVETERAQLTDFSECMTLCHLGQAVAAPAIPAEEE